jgi:hypothetical protein
LARRLPGKWLRWEWFKPRKLALPQAYAEFAAQLGPQDFDPASGEGVLATSPLWVTPRIRPRRIGFLFSAGSEAALADLRSRFALRPEA